MIAMQAPETIDDYLALPYTVEVIPNEEGYFARVIELPGCMTWTDRIEDLWPMVDDAKRAWIGVSLEYSDPIPVPASSSPEALVVRVPTELQRDLRRRATEDGVTLDQFVTRTLARAVGK